MNSENGGHIRPRRAPAALVLLLALAMLCLGPAAAQGRVGGLDRSFGTNGKLTTQFPVSGGRQVASAVDGSLILSSGLVLTRFTPTGVPDLGFGDGGQVLLPELIDGMAFGPASIAIDSQGRVLVFGTVTDSSREYVDHNLLRSFPATSAVVMRLDPAGKLDLGFGEGKGYFRSDFGLLTELRGAEIPTTQAGKGLVDSWDRPVFIASVLGAAGRCFYGKGFVSPYPRAVIRLTATGILDPTFGSGDGLTEIAGGEGPAALGIDGSGGVVAATEIEECKRGGARVFRFSGDGAPLPAFGTNGVREYRSMYFAAMEPSGALTLGKTLRREEVLTQAVVRTEASGEFDPRFGKRGKARLDLPMGASRTMKVAAVDARRRVVLVGSFEVSKPRTTTRSYLVVMRLLANGKIDLAFGNRGRIVTRFDRPRSITVRDAELDPQERLVVAVGSVSAGQPRGAKLTLARYLLNR